MCIRDRLKWVERPAIPTDAAKQLELMKFLPGGTKTATRSRPALLLAGAISIIAFSVVFVLLFLVLRRSMPAGAGIVLFVGVGFLAYLAWVFLRASRRGIRSVSY